VNLWNRIFDFTETENGKKNMEILKRSQFKIITNEDILPNTELPIDQNILEPDFLYELPIEFGGTLDINSVVKSKD